MRLPELMIGASALSVALALSALILEKAENIRATRNFQNAAADALTGLRRKKYEEPIFTDKDLEEMQHGYPEPPEIDEDLVKEAMKKT